MCPDPSSPYEGVDCETTYTRDMSALWHCTGAYTAIMAFQNFCLLQPLHQVLSIYNEGAKMPSLNESARQQHVSISHMLLASHDPQHWMTHIIRAYHWYAPVLWVMVKTELMKDRERYLWLLSSRPCLSAGQALAVCTGSIEMPFLHPTSYYSFNVIFG